METRKVTIINSKTQSQSVIQDSKATTLGELKQEMRDAGIDYENMTFFEGHMRAELKDDASTLPTNIPYKGQVVNDLVFMLTAPEKKIKSGTMTRAEVYAEIKKRNLQSDCMNLFGKNFTQCSTADLISLIEKVSVMEADSTVGAYVEETPDTSAKETECPVNPVSVLAEALYVNGYITHDIYATVLSMLTNDSHNMKSEKEVMSKKEIDEMFDFIK